MLKIIKQFSIIYIILSILSLPFEAIMALIDFDTGTASSIIVTGLSGAYVGYKYAKQFNEIPTSALSWKISFYTLPVMFLMGILLSILVYFLDPTIFSTFENLGLINLLLTLLAIFILASLMHVVSVRIFIRMFAKYTLKNYKK